jgi:hypothetical protein
MPGPPPKRSDQRRRRNAPSIPIAKVDGAAATQPPLGLEVHALVADWYAALAAGPEAQFYTPAMWQRARIVARMLDGVITAGRPSSQMYAALQADMKSLLVDAGELRRLGIEVQAAPSGARRQQRDRLGCPCRRRYRWGLTGSRSGFLLTTGSTLSAGRSSSGATSTSRSLTATPPASVDVDEPPDPLHGLVVRGRRAGQVPVRPRPAGPPEGLGEVSPGVGDRLLRSRRPRGLRRPGRQRPPGRSPRILTVGPARRGLRGPDGQHDGAGARDAARVRRCRRDPRPGPRPDPDLHRQRTPRARHRLRPLA